MLFNEPKLLKSVRLPICAVDETARFSALQRAEIAEMCGATHAGVAERRVSVLFNEPKLLKCPSKRRRSRWKSVSVLFNEPKLLKSSRHQSKVNVNACFSALQRAEIAEMRVEQTRPARVSRVSVLFNEPKLLKSTPEAKQRQVRHVSVLFNEPKLLKSSGTAAHLVVRQRFSALQRAEIAEMSATSGTITYTINRFSALQRAEIAEIASCASRSSDAKAAFQCSSTSRNC